MLTRDISDKVRLLHIRTRRLVDGAFAGDYLSLFKGRGMEFAEVRPYSPGDDVRAIDWNITARTGEPYIKRFHEERDLTVMVLVDRSASLFFGSHSQLKATISSEIAALLAFSAMRNNNNAGLVLFTDRVEAVIKPQKGQNRALRLMQTLVTHEPAAGGTRITAALDYLNKAFHRRSVTFLISDFHDTDYAPALQMAAKNHDIVPIILQDPLEQALPDVGIVAMRDLESGQWVYVDSSSKRTRRDLQEKLTEARRARARLFNSLGIDRIEMATDKPYLPALLRFFAERDRKKQRRAA